ncbi:MAG: hypothetical protein HY606_03105 [Planctomycetes bacterium]|nr:hypothetical protein [Planctomycetota bacterium]
MKQFVKMSCLFMTIVLFPLFDKNGRFAEASDLLDISDPNIYFSAENYSEVMHFSGGSNAEMIQSIVSMLNSFSLLPQCDINNIFRDCPIPCKDYRIVYVYIFIGQMYPDGYGRMCRDIDVMIVLECEDNRGNRSLSWCHVRCSFCVQI